MIFLLKYDENLNALKVSMQLKVIMAYSTALFILTFPTEAYAFARFLLMDPDFIEYIFINVPMSAIAIFTIWESLYLLFIVKPSTSEGGVKFSLFIMMMAANIFAMIFNILLVFALIIIIGDGVFSVSTEIAWIGIIYFSILFTYIGNLTKDGMFKELFIMNEAKGLIVKTSFSDPISYQNEKKKSKKTSVLSQSLKKHILLMNLISHLGLFIYLYYDLF